MTVNYKTGSFTKDDSDVDDVDDVISGLGFTPKLIVLFTAQTTGQDSSQDGSAFGMGVSDGTTEKSMWSGSKDNQSVSDAARFVSDSKALTIRSVSGTIGALSSECDVSIQADGFTATWTTNDSSALVIGWIAYGGDEITVDIFEFTQPNSTGTNISQSVPTSLDTANFVMLFGIASSTKNSTVTSSIGHLGMATGPSNEGAICGFGADNNTPANTTRNLVTNGIIAMTTTTVFAQAEFTNFTNLGFDLNWTSITSASPRVIIGFTIKGGNWEVNNGSMKSTPDGTKSFTTPFKPQGLMVISTGSVATGVLDQKRNMFGASHGVSNDVSIVETDTDNVNPTDTRHGSSATYCLDPRGFSGTAVSRGKVDSFNALNFTLDFDDTDGNTRLFVWAVVEESVAAAVANIADSLSLGGGIVSRKLIASRAPTSQSIPFTDVVTGIIPLVTVTINDTIPNFLGTVARKLTARRELKEEFGGYTDIGFTDIGYTKDTGGISLTGIVTSQIVISRSVADSIPSFTGVVSRILHAVRSIADTIPFTDSVAGALTGITRSISDSLSPLSSSVSRKLLANRSISNSLTPLTGVVNAATVIVRTLSDSLTPLTGSVAVLQTFGRSISDSLTPLTGVVSRILHAKRNVTGNITFSDVVTGITAQIANIADSISPFSGSVSVKGIFQRTINDSISLASSVIANMNHFVSLADSLTLTGIVTALTVIVRNISDGIGLTGVVNRTLHAVRNLTESISLSSIVSALIASTTNTRKVIGSFKANDSIKKGLKSFLDIKKGLKS